MMFLYSNDEGRRVIVSYLTLRKALGVLGVLLPVVLALLCFWFGTCAGIEESISAYYGTEVRDIFVGVLFVIGLFLFAYRGYERKDDIAGDLACIFALGTALFPTTSETDLIRVLHFVFATLLFLALSYFSLALFTKTKPGVPPTEEKKKRNKIYRACGVIMLVCIALIALFKFFLVETPVAALKPVFWLESLALWAFGVSWMTKGEMLWKDATQPTP